MSGMSLQRHEDSPRSLPLTLSWRTERRITPCPKSFCASSRWFLQLQPGFKVALPKANHVLHPIRNAVYDRNVAHWHTPMASVVKGCQLCRRTREMEHCTCGEFSGKTPACSHWPLAQDNVAPNFCLAYAFTNIQVHMLIKSDEPDQVSTYLQICFKTRKQNLKLTTVYGDRSWEYGRKSQQKLMGSVLGECPRLSRTQRAVGWLAPL